MKKQLNTTAVINELKGASVFFKREPERIATPPSAEETENENGETKIAKTQSIDRSTSRSFTRPVSQSTDPSTAWSIDRTAILGRPKAFYITEKQDEDLDVAVEKLNRKMGKKIDQKIDRSTLIRLVLEESDITNERTIDRLASRLVGRLISRLTS